MRFSYQKIMIFLITLLILLQPLTVSAATSGETYHSTDVCLQATQTMEKKYHIKQHLLTTIASIESGRWNEATQQKVAWPWTINAQGKGYFFDSKAEAVKKVKALQAQGISSIDVGCMQVNLLYHGQEFSSIEEAFEPTKNVEYAAKFLTDLYESNNHDWLKAAMTYHSSVPEKANIYRQKIVKAFEVVKSAHNESQKQVLEARASAQPQKLKVASIPTPQQPKIKLVQKVVHNNKPQPTKHKKSEHQMDVRAWREAKLEEYRVQKLLARRY